MNVLHLSSDTGSVPVHREVFDLFPSRWQALRFEVRNKVAVLTGRNWLAHPPKRFAFIADEDNFAARAVADRPDPALVAVGTPFLGIDGHGTEYAVSTSEVTE